MPKFQAVLVLVRVVVFILLESEYLLAFLSLDVFKRYWKFFIAGWDRMFYFIETIFWINNFVFIFHWVAFLFELTLQVSLDLINEEVR